MGMTERQRAIVEILKCRRQETIANLAFEFGVSERTIRRDIDMLSMEEPIITKIGRCGGVYFVGKHVSSPRFMSEEEVAVLEKNLNIALTQQINGITTKDISILNKIIEDFKVPIKKGGE